MKMGFTGLVCLVLLLVGPAHSLPGCAGLAPPFCDCHPGNCSCASCGSCSACNSCVKCSGPIPPPTPPVPAPTEWVARAAAGQMIYRSTDPADGFFPPFGNGFISGDAGCSSVSPLCKGGNGFQGGSGSCGAMHMAGVFNNVNGVPHRADLPNPFAATVAAARRGQAAVDFERAVVTNRSFVSCEAGGAVPILVSTYAHREHRSLLVLHVAAEALTAGQSCTVQLQSCGLAWSNARDFVGVRRSGANATTVQAVVHTMEAPPSWSSQAKSPPTAVGLAVQSLPSTVRLTAEQPDSLFVAAYRSSLEPGVDAAAVGDAALAYLQAHVGSTAEQLMASHQAAWSKLWEGGIEIEGNMTIATTVNSSLYYILSAVRDDWPLGLSPGGLSRDDYEGHSFWDCGICPLPAWTDRCR